MKKTVQWGIAIPSLLIVSTLIYFIIPRAKGFVVNKNALTNVPPSIAVLPFVNLDSNQNQQYFSDGLTDEIRNSLSQVKDLKVSV
jgi:hypothetical protein